MSVGSEHDLHERARRTLARLTEYEDAHPAHGPDAQGREYDPWHHVVLGAGTGGDSGERIDVVRTEVIARRTWEGFAWANHRFVLSDAYGHAVIVGFNEDAGCWFVDTNTPARLPAAWVDQFIDDFTGDRVLSGLEDPSTLHREIVTGIGERATTVPSHADVEDHLRRRRAADAGAPPEGRAARH